MKCEFIRFDQVTVNFDRKRVPLSSKQRSEKQGEFRYFGAQGVIDYVDDYIFDGTYLLIAEDGENLKSKKQNIAQIVEGQFWVNNHAHVLQTNERCNLRYLCYLINSMDLSGYITGSAQPKLSQSNLNAVMLPLPSVEVQNSIVRILGALDNKIELNNKINANLQQQADLIYNELFQNESEFCELGSMVETTSGGTPSRKQPQFYENGSILWVKSKELSGGFIYATEEKINKIALTKTAVKLLPPHSILVAMYGATVGECGIISSSMTCNQAICALLPNDKYPYTYLYQLIRHSKEQLKNMAIGSAQQNISQVLIKKMPIHSNQKKVKEFDVKTQPYFKMMELLTLEHERLINMRKILLPKLMSGEVSV